MMQTPAGLKSTEEEKESRFGALSRFFDRVTSSKQKDKSMSGQESDYFAPHLDDKSPVIMGARPARGISNKNGGY